MLTLTTAESGSPRPTLDDDDDNDNVAATEAEDVERDNLRTKLV
jgi:hypothetical protein